MLLNIDLNGVKNSFIAAYNTATTKASEWMGHGIVIIKSKTETALPYLQDKRIAAVSLIAVTLLVAEFVNLLAYFWNKHFPNDTALKRGVRDFVDVTAGVAMIAGGVAAFAKYTKVPFSPLAILGISAGTIVLRARFS